MKKNKDDLSTLKQVQQLKKAQQDAHNEEVQQIINELYHSDDSYQKIKAYNQKKRMKWWSYLISLSLSVILTGIAFLLGFITKSSHVINYTTVVELVLTIIIMMVLNYMKNRHAEKFFNDKRRRYQRTLTIEEAKIFLTLKILFLGLILFLPTIISVGIIYGY